MTRFKCDAAAFPQLILSQLDDVHYFCLRLFADTRHRRRCVLRRHATLLLAHRIGAGTNPVAASASVDGSSFGDVNLDKVNAPLPLCIIHQNRT
jgi:hypothetical protein